MVKLTPNKEQHGAILETMHRFNEQRIVACNEVKAVIGIEVEHSYKPLLESGGNMPPAFRWG